tara:strand:+ start:623 stop:1267 length:645 start_codon:yes stop_codon:yes gene_type:complete
MSDKIKIDIVSDVVCPWCLIGYKRLEKAIYELGVNDRVEIEWQPFELNPGMSAQGEISYDYRSRKYGATKEDTDRQTAYLTRLGAEEGFTFDFFDGIKIINSQDAHILLDYAKDFGLQTALNLRLVSAFYSERKDISDRDILHKELLTVGLNADEAIKRLDNADARTQIQREEKHWINKGVTGVPAMFFNSLKPIVGAQSVSTYKQVLTEELGL